MFTVYAAIISVNLHLHFPPQNSTFSTATLHFSPAGRQRFVILTMHHEMQKRETDDDWGTGREIRQSERDRAMEWEKGKRRQRRQRENR